MVAESFEAFILVSAGSSGACVGLLDVAIVIGPRRTVGVGATTDGWDRAGRERSNPLSPRKGDT